MVRNNKNKRKYMQSNNVGYFPRNQHLRSLKIKHF